MASIAPRQLLSQEPQTAASGSQTTTIPGPSSAPAVSSDPDQQQPVAILRLRGTNSRDSRNVQWAEGVVDNEGMNRKKSKVCCIYHRPRAVDESSDDSSSSDSDSSSFSDDDSDDGLAARSDADQAFRGRTGGADTNARWTAHHRHTPDCPEHEHGGYGSSSNEEGGSSGGKLRGNKNNKGKGKGKRKPSPNAYEKMPRHGKPSTPGV